MRDEKEREKGAKKRDSIASNADSHQSITAERRNSLKKRKSVSYNTGEWKTVGTPTEISMQVI